jgi:NYN domain/OST-HTH/LOTUS domain
MATDEERIALFIDHENLVLGAREIGRSFDVGPIFDALAERGRVVARRAYADWTLFADDRRSLVEHNCELIDIPQRTGAVRKNAADIKLAVDAMELAYERGFVSTFVIASGDSDFTPLVAALRALNRRVIGIGVKGSTSALLPPACDEFLFYDRLPGVAEPAQRGARGNGKARAAAQAAQEAQDRERAQARNGGRDLQDVQRLVTQTLAGLTQSGTEPVLASTLKRALLRKDPTFSESDYGFRAFGELLRQLERNGVISLAVGQAPGDPAVDFPDTGQSAQAFETLRKTVLDLQGADDEVPLSGLKDQLRKRVPDWSEKDLGYSGFLQFAKAAAASGVVSMEWDEDEGDYFLYVPDD